MQSLSFDAGDWLLHPGELGNSLFFVREGELDVVAPQKDQQLYFLTLVGPNANLGNITPSEVIALEAMRIGLRGDTFDLFLKDS